MITLQDMDEAIQHIDEVLARLSPECGCYNDHLKLKEIIEYARTKYQEDSHATINKV